jgi:cyclohexadieny/prephenate dehydrogenase
VRRLTVVGLGLLGGSIARAARARGVAREIAVVSRNRAMLDRARDEGVADLVTDHLTSGLAEAELVILCVPVGVVPSLLRSAWPHLARGAILSDVGSVKAGIVAAAESCPRREEIAFVGGHPMAGSERSGFDAADPDLFRDRLTLLTPTPRTPAPAVARLTAFWEALGSEVRLMAPEVHDRAVARVSHLPHLAAYGLVSVGDGEALAVAGRGFADTTRVAASAEGLWTDIFRNNQSALLEALAEYRETLSRWEGYIRDEDWPALEASLARAREIREKLS